MSSLLYIIYFHLKVIFFLNYGENIRSSHAKKRRAISHSSLGLIKSESLPHLDLGRQKYKIAHLLCYTLSSNFGRSRLV